MVKYFWSESNGVDRPTVRYMDFEPSTEYYNGMPLKKNEAGAVMPTTGEPEYICMWDYQPDGDIRTLEIPVIEIFPDAIYEKWNEDGTVEEVRFGSGGGGLPSDLVETVPDEVPLVITWDRNADGKEIAVSNGDLYCAKVSDTVLTANDLLGSEIIIAKDDGTFEAFVVAKENLQDMSEMGAPMVAILTDNYDYPIVQIVFSDFSMAGMSMSAGVWFLDDPGRYYVFTFTCPNVMIPGGERTQIKPEFMPPHKHKWDDIEDQPFYDKSKSEPLNITFDGDLTGKEIMSTGEESIMIKVSDSILNFDQLLGSTVTFVMGGEESTMVLSEEYIVDASANGMPVYILNEFIFCAYDDISSQGMNLTSGVWFGYVEGELLIKSLSNPNVTITTGELKKLDPKFYDQPCGEKVGDVFYSSTLTTTTTAGMNIAYVQEPILYQTEKVLVSIDGNEEIKEVKTRDDVNNQVWYTVGNSSLYFDDAENTGEPYLLLCSFLGETPQSAAFITRIGGSYDVKLAGIYAEPLPEKYIPDLNQLTMLSPSGKKFKVTVDDSGKLTAVEV